jgi:hypothetical protein
VIFRLWEWKGGLVSTFLLTGVFVKKKYLETHSDGTTCREYIYGQIHFDGLIQIKKIGLLVIGEGIIADDEKYHNFLRSLREDVCPVVLDDWENGEGKTEKLEIPDNPSITPKERKSEELIQYCFRGLPSSNRFKEQNHSRYTG